MKTLHVVVRALTTNLTENDAEIQGVYAVEVQSDVSLEFQAWGALQAFHKKIGIDEIDNFECVVRDPQTQVELVQAYDEPTSTFSYSFDGKIADIKNTQRIRLVLDVDYELNGVSVEELSQNIGHMVMQGIGNGMLTGSSDAEVITYATNISPRNNQSPALLEDDPEKLHNSYVFQPGIEDCFIEVGNISVHIIKDDDGITVDLWPVGDATEPFSTNTVQFAEIEKDICRYYDDVQINDVSVWVNSVHRVQFDQESLSKRAKWIAMYSDHCLTKNRLGAAIDNSETIPD